MSKITPLSNSHELGLHGNCKDKDEANLLVIREVTNIKIYQLSKFKKSNFDINNFSLDGYKLPNESGLSTGNENLRILWQAPNVWMIISYNENIIQEIGKQCSDSDFAITDLSHSRAILEVKGKDALNVIKKGSPLNLNNFRTKITTTDLDNEGFEIEKVFEEKISPLLVYEQGKTKLYLGFDNFRVITKYNRSSKYALAVHQLAVEISKRFDE